ncbi:MAG: futalosine hydrolase [Desulfobulbaceae bacterium]|nr:futalosine hydrolase [Desulfobulbaceae bacterium]
MILLTAATPFEMDAFVQAGPKLPVQRLVCGIGPTEAALHLSVFLSQSHILPRAVINIGVAGAYLGAERTADLLDICLATSEELGDLCCCRANQLLPLTIKGCTLPSSFKLDESLRLRVEKQLAAAGIISTSGRFITVSSVSGDRARGNMVLQRYPDALCENMEGAALARVCAYFRLPFAEIRCISNLVDDPDNQQWHLQEACTRCGQAAAILFQEPFYD